LTLFLLTQRKSCTVLGIPDINPQLRASTLTRVRFIESRLLPLVPIFESYSETFAGLSQLNQAVLARGLTTKEQCQRTHQTLQNMLHQNAAYARNTKFLLRKITSTADLLSDALALKNQHVAQEHNDHLFKLANLSHLQNESICAMAQITVQDSATIKVITVATLAFLPSTFVAVSLAHSSSYTYGRRSC
jgi:hypothetical protein